MSEIPCPRQCPSWKNLLCRGGVCIPDNVRDTLTQTMSELEKFALQGGGYPRQCPRYPNLDNVRDTLPRTMSELEKFALQGGYPRHDDLDNI